MPPNQPIPKSAPDTDLTQLITNLNTNVPPPAHYPCAPSARFRQLSPNFNRHKKKKEPPKISQHSERRSDPISAAAAVSSPPPNCNRSGQNGGRRNPRRATDDQLRSAHRLPQKPNPPATQCVLASARPFKITFQCRRERRSDRQRPKSRRLGSRNRQDRRRRRRRPPQHGPSRRQRSHQASRCPKHRPRIRIQDHRRPLGRERFIR